MGIFPLFFRLRALLIQKSVKPFPTVLALKSGLRALLIQKSVKPISLLHIALTRLRALLIQKSVKLSSGSERKRAV